MSKDTIWWKPIAHFAGHLFVGTVIFLLFGAVSVGLGFLVHYLEGISSIPRFTIQVLTFVESAILITDTVLYLAYLGITAWGSIKEMMK